MFQKISYSQKFLPGADLWCIFFEPQRELFKTINWRTHFLIQNLNDTQELSKALLLDTQDVFSNKSLLCLPLKLHKQMYDFWKQLDKPSLRAFLPLIAEEDLLEPWLKFETNYKVSYYREKVR